MTPDPPVTLVVTPREKFSACRDSLDSILAHTAVPHRLVYVDGGSPGPVRRMVAARARERGFEHLRRDRHLTPNRARLIGLARVRTPWTVFVDNDVVVSPGWLETLLRCGEESGAAAVSPLICQGRPLHTVVHCAGGECGVKEIRTDDGEVERHLHERIARQGRKVADVRAKLVRGPTGLAEFHCVMVRTDVARAPGMIDPGILNTREHIDFCMNVRAAGGEIWLEPDSVVTYLHDAPIGPSDLRYYMLRWSDGWERRSLQHLIAKWGLTTSGTAGYRLGNVGWRRRQYLVGPFAERLAAAAPDGFARRTLRRAVMGGERRLNALLCALHERGERRGCDGSGASGPGGRPRVRGAARRTALQVRWPKVRRARSSARARISIAERSSSALFSRGAAAATRSRGMPMASIARARSSSSRTASASGRGGCGRFRNIRSWSTSLTPSSPRIQTRSRGEPPL